MSISLDCLLQMAIVGCLTAGAILFLVYKVLNLESRLEREEIWLDTQIKSNEALKIRVRDLENRVRDIENVGVTNAWDTGKLNNHD